jgi:hypothetical protein
LNRNLGPAVGLLGAFLAKTASVAAQEAARVEYRAEGACPDEAAFLGRIRERTSRLKIERGPSASRTFSVVVRPTGGGYAGRLTLREKPGVTSTEHVAGATCEEVVDALALVLALAIDPEAASVQPPPPPLPRPPPPVAIAPVIVDTKEAPERRWSLAATFGAGVTGAVAPAVLPTISASVELDAPLGRSVLSPSVAAFVRHGAVHDQPGPQASTASYDWTTGGLRACLARWVLGPTRSKRADPNENEGRESEGPLRLRIPCVEGEAGLLRVVGGNLVTPGQASRPWIDVAATAWVEWMPFWPIFVVVDGGLLFPTTRDRFHIDGPDRTVHDVPAVTGRVEGALGVRFL